MKEEQFSYYIYLDDGRLQSCERGMEIIAALVLLRMVYGDSCSRVEQWMNLQKWAGRSGPNMN